MPLQTHAQRPQELEAYIASLHNDLQGLMHMRDEERS